MSQLSPSSPDSITILEKIGRLKLTSTETALVSFLLSNTEMVARLQLNDLAKQAYVSSATISRFVRKLGFKNYSDFRVAFVKEHSQTSFPDMVVNYDTPLHQNMSTRDIENTIFTILYVLYACHYEKDFSQNMEYIQSILKRNHIQE